jgi:hypothetical protein
MKSYISGCVISDFFLVIASHLYSHRSSVNFLWDSSVHVLKYKKFSWYCQDQSLKSYFIICLKTHWFL